MLKYRFVILKVILLALFYCVVSTAVMAKDILIFSTSHNNEGILKVNEQSGYIEVEISSLSPILEITLDGQKLPLR